MSLYSLAYEMLETTNPYVGNPNDLSFCNEDGYMISLCEKISEALEGKKEYPEEKAGRNSNVQTCYDVIAKKMEEYLKQYPAPYSYCKERRVEFAEWLSKIGTCYSVKKAEIPKYFILSREEKDQAVILVKELQDRNGKSKDELSRAMEISRRNVQANLRRLDLGSESLDDGKDFSIDNIPFFVGGHPVLSEVSVKNGWPPRYYTSESIHPIVLLENVLQTVVILQALARNYRESEEPGCNAYIAIDIWSQLSGFAREKIRSIFAENDPELVPFLEMISKKCPGNQISSCIPDRNKIKELDE